MGNTATKTGESSPDGNIHASVINLSNNCMERLTCVPDEQEQPAIEEPPKSPKQIDEEWMMKLKCLDDIHSNKYSLTIQAVDALFKSLEEYFFNIPIPPCNYRPIFYCLKSNDHCMIYCKKLLDDFVETIDTLRINKLKDRLDYERKLAKAQETKRFFKY